MRLRHFTPAAFRLRRISASSVYSRSLLEAQWAHAMTFSRGPAEPVSETVANLLAAVRQDDQALVTEMTLQARDRATAALAAGPDEWVPARLYEQLMRRFATVNLRAILPARPNGFWNPLIDSLITRIPGTWEFFPSQIQAISGRLLEDGAELYAPNAHWFR